MTAMTRLILFTILFLTCTQIRSQSLSVSGKIMDETKNPTIGVTVILLNHDSSFLKASTTDESGLFKIERLSANTSYMLKIIYIGYNPAYKLFQAVNAPVDLGPIYLIPNSKILKQVEVEGKAPLATQNGDTTNYNANAYKVNKDATAEDLVTKMPGVTVVDGKVQAQGEDVKQVLVDGKAFFGDDASAVLKNLPAEVVDKIQVFDKKSDQAQFTGVDDGNTSKTINIVTKIQFRNGTFGKVYAGAGLENKYKAGGSVNIFKDNRRITVLVQSNNINDQNFSSEDLVGVASSGGGAGGRGRGGNHGGGPGGPGGQNSNTADNFLTNTQNGINTPTALGLNYSDKWGKKTEISGSYFFNQTKNNSVSTLSQQYVLGSNNGLVYQESNQSDYTNQNNRINLKLETKLDSQNAITFQPRLSFQTNDGSKTLMGENRRNGVDLSSTKNTSASNLLGYSISLPVLYRHSFPKRGRTFSINATPAFTKNTGESTLITNNLYYNDTSIIGDTIDQKSNTYKNGNSISSNITYTEPINKTSFLSFTYSNSYAQNYSSKKTYNKNNLSSEYNDLDSLYTNVFRSQYQTQSGGIGYRYQKEKINIFVNAAYQRSLLDKDQEIPTAYTLAKTFNSILPSAMLMYKFTAQKNLRIFYRTSNNAPSIDQLQEVINNSNSLQLTTGNPDLKQDFQQNLNLRYSAVNTKKANSFFALLGGNYATNYIGNSTLIANKDTFVYNQIYLPRGSQIQRPINLDGYFSLRSFVNYTFPISKIKTNISFNLSGNYNRIPGFINNEKNFANTMNSSVGLVLSSNISEKIDFTVSSNSAYSNTANSLQTSSNTTYFNQNSKVKITFSPSKSLVLFTEYSNLKYTGLTAAYNQSISLWNAAIAYKFMKNKEAEFRLSANDILNQNNSIQRTNTESYTQDLQTNVLNRFYMLTFNYNFKKYKSKR